MPALVPAAVIVALLTGCSADIAPTSSSWADGITAAPLATSTASATVEAAAPEVAAPAAAPAAVDYVSPVQKRWGACFSRLGIGDLYYDSVTGTVTAAWNGGAVAWTVGPGDASGTPADQASVDALAGC